MSPEDEAVPVHALATCYRALAGLTLTEQESVLRCLLTLCRLDAQAILEAVEYVLAQPDLQSPWEAPGASPSPPAA